MWNFVVGIIGNLIASLIEWGLKWLWRHKLITQLSKIQWQLSGNVWWLACDLHTIKLQPMLNNPGKIPAAISQALKHAHAIGADQKTLSQIQALNGIKPFHTERLQKAVDPIIEHFGVLAVANQPDFES